MNIKAPFCNAMYRGRSSLIDSQECTNFYPELTASPDGKNQISLIGTPGMKYFCYAGSGSNRGMFTTARERLLTVIGNTLYEINANKTTTTRGTLKTNTGRIEFAEIQMTAVGIGGSHVMLIDGQYGYIFRTDTNEFTQITEGYQSGTSVIAIGGRFLQNVNDTGTCIWSDLYDGLTWNSGLNYFVTEGSPDPIQSIKSINNEIWLFGSKSSEVWAQTGVSTKPFAKINVAYINTGAAGKFATTTMQNQVFWVGNNVQGTGSVWQASGYLPARISTHAIEYIINSMETVSDCIAWSYAQEGHQFIVFTFPSGNRTLVYDVATQMWHERSSYESLSGKNNYHRAVIATLWNNKVMVGDHANNNIYELDLDYYTDNAVTIKRVRTAPHLHADRKEIIYHSMEIDMERGVGLTHLSDSTNYQYTVDPQAMLQWSDDGGSVWSNEYWQAIGQIGERTNRVKWNRLGMSRDRVFRLTITAPVKCIIVDGFIDITVVK